LFDCIDKTLFSILGKASVATFYYAIEEEKGLSEADFPKKPMVMLRKLKEILGGAGFVILEKSIAIAISERFGIERDKSEGSLNQIVALAKSNFMLSSSNERYLQSRSLNEKTGESLENRH
jgi:hypothetical protein